MEKYLYIFCSNVRYLHKAYHMSAMEMAQVLGVSVPKLRRIEKGDINVRINCDMLWRLCDYFHLSADTMIRVNLETDSYNNIEI